MNAHTHTHTHTPPPLPLPPPLPPEYATNLVAFVHQIRLAQPHAKVGWMSSTPMHFDMHLNANVDAYNRAAADALRLHFLPGPRGRTNRTRKGPRGGQTRIEKGRGGGQTGIQKEPGAVVDGFVDNHAAIIHACGSPPYYGPHAFPNTTNHCPLINPDEEYHYNTAGYTLLAKTVAAGIRKLLNSGQQQTLIDNHTPYTPQIPHYPRTDDSQVQRCDDHKTACPGHMSCVHDKYSRSGFGCCPVPNGTGCGDGFHCCGNFFTNCRGNGSNPLTPGQPPRPGVYNHVCVR